MCGQCNVPPRECPQCWHHAHVVHNFWSAGYVPSKGDCKQCVDHMYTRCGTRPDPRTAG